MSDERMQPLLDAWFRDRDEPARDVGGDIARVMADVPRTRQQGRWWPLPAFDRRAKAKTLTTNGITDYQPSPIPATNGHAPTVIGRTQTMLSPVKAITAGALVFAIGGVMLIAQPFDQQPQGGAPGAQSDDGEVYTIVSYEVISESEEGPVVYVHAKEASDPRLSGTWTEFWDCADYQRGDIEVCVGSVRVENEGGTWLGRTEGFWAAPELAPGYTVPYGFHFTVLEGQGDYAGLTVLHQDTWNAEEGEAEVGVIFEGALPPVPEPVE
jgi:hypothetical protein